MSRNVIESPSVLPVSQELQDAQKGMREVDRREEPDYDVIVLWRKLGNALFLTMEFKDQGEVKSRLPEIELPSPDDNVTNRVEDAKIHPMKYYAAVGVRTESFFGDGIDSETFEAA